MNGLWVTLVKIIHQIVASILINMRWAHCFYWLHSYMCAIECRINGSKRDGEYLSLSFSLSLSLSLSLAHNIPVPCANLAAWTGVTEYLDADVPTTTTVVSRPVCKSCTALVFMALHTNATSGKRKINDAARGHDYSHYRQIAIN